MRNIKEIENNNTIKKLERIPVGASIARPYSNEHTIVSVGAILIACRPLNNSLKHNQSGITLIALIITIIILLILASITINLTLGERGIFNTAKRAVENYKDAEEREFAEFNNFEQEAFNAINNIGNEKIEEKPILLNTVTSANYGDYVNYPVSIGKGPDETAHKTDWRIFYNDGTYVYLISSYLLLNSEMPVGTTMVGYEGRPYTTYWTNKPANYTTITDNVRTKYKMSWNNNTTNDNIICVSELLDTTKWKKFAYNTVNGNVKNIAEDAIGGPTIEMWIESWNEKGNTKIYYGTNNTNGYYISKTNNPTTGDSVNELSTNDNLYFPVTTYTENDGYWIAAPSSNHANHVIAISGGSIMWASYGGTKTGVRPVVRLKSDVMGVQDSSDIWQLQ